MLEMNRTIITLSLKFKRTNPFKLIYISKEATNSMKSRMILSFICNIYINCSCYKCTVKHCLNRIQYLTSELHLVDLQEDVFNEWQL